MRAQNGILWRVAFTAVHLFSFNRLVSLCCEEHVYMNKYLAA